MSDILSGIPSMIDRIGNTPLVRLRNVLPDGSTNILLAKLEGHNPAGSVKDRAALSMITGLEERGQIKKGDLLFSPTSGNTGIALAMVAALKGYRMRLIMPETATVERRQAMRAYGGEVVLTAAERGMEGAIDRGHEMALSGEGTLIDQFSNPDNPLAHYRTTGPEIWRDTGGKVTHFVSAMGTTGTIMGCSRFFQDLHKGEVDDHGFDGTGRDKVTVVGVRPEEGSRIPGIRRWEKEYLPKVYEPARVDKEIDISQAEAEEMARTLAKDEGLLCGISSGGAVAAALKLDKELENSVIVTIICDGGMRYLSTGVFK